MSQTIFELAMSRAHEGMEIAAIAEAVPERTALVTGAETLSYLQLNERCNQLANLLLARGITAGDSMALICSNRVEFALVRFAAHRIGVRLTPINWHLTADEMAYIVENCEAKVVFADQRVGAAVEQACGELGNLLAKFSIGGEIAGFEDLLSSMEGYPSTNIPSPVLGSTMNYTSGTTGRPKGVYRKPADPSKAGEMMGLFTAVFQFQPDSGKDIALSTGPLYHAGPYNVCFSIPITCGIGSVLMDKWDAEETLALIDKHKITHTFMVPTMLHRLLQLEGDIKSKYDLSSLRFVLHGAAPCPKTVKQQALDWFGPILWEMFNGTEGAGTFVSPQEWLKKPGTVGKPRPGQMKIVKEDGSLAAANEAGMIYIENPEASGFEYYKDKKKTNETIKDGFYSAGDIGYLDEDGYLFLSGRSAEIIISGGVNIYPQEIDDVLIKHPWVQDVACIGVPNEEWGEEVKAVVELIPGIDNTENARASLIDFMGIDIAKQKQPKSFDFVEKLPRSEAGKVLRKKLRDSYWAEQQNEV